MSVIQQITNRILMVRPAHFSFNEETATNNAFQTKETALTAEEVRLKAIEEFDHFVAKLQQVGVEVIVAQDSDHPIKPDAIFPNNWATYHHDGKIITYPMYAPVRRLERSTAILEQLKERFAVREIVPLESAEADEVYLEGTGSMILDRPNRLVYACLSPRTDAGVLDKFCDIAGYEKVVLHAVDAQGQAIYHTNVMMALGETFVVVCLDTVTDAAERQHLLDRFAATQKEVIAISLEQMMRFAGNMLQVKGADKNYLVMSEQAFQSLTPTQLRAIEDHTGILYAPIYTIETFGGGSARCMMAEVFLPEKSSK